jgi:hypothetical protein
MDKITVLQNMLSLISADMEKLSAEIRDYSEKQNIEQNFDEISRLITKNRRMLSRAKQISAEISFLSK